MIEHLALFHERLFAFHLGIYIQNTHYDMSRIVFGNNSVQRDMLDAVAQLLPVSHGDSSVFPQILKKRLFVQSG